MVRPLPNRGACERVQRMFRPRRSIFQGNACVRQVFPTEIVDWRDIGAAVDLGDWVG